MHDYLQYFALAVLQGATEFLPVSSAGHLALWSRITGSGENILALIIAAHVGSFAAVVIYFRGEVAEILCGWYHHLRGRGATLQSNLAWAVVVATVMIVAVGFLAAAVVNRIATMPVVIAAMTLIFGVALGLADRFGRCARELIDLRWADALLMGGAQILALVPGVSRSGVTISAARALGFSRDAAARFSFLLAMPVIFLAGVWQAHALLARDAVAWGGLLFTAVVSAVAAFLCLHYFLAFLRRHSLLPFAIYRVILGGVLLAIYM